MRDVLLACANAGRLSLQILHSKSVLRQHGWISKCLRSRRKMREFFWEKGGEEGVRQRLEEGREH